MGNKGGQGLDFSLLSGGGTSGCRGLSSSLGYQGLCAFQGGTKMLRDLSPGEFKQA